MPRHRVRLVVKGTAAQRHMLSGFPGAAIQLCRCWN